MRKTLTKVAATALLSTIAVMSVPVDTATAGPRLDGPGWTLDATRNYGGQTIYRYVHSSGQVAYTSHKLSDSGWTRTR